MTAVEVVIPVNHPGNTTIMTNMTDMTNIRESERRGHDRPPDARGACPIHHLSPGPSALSLGPARVASGGDLSRAWLEMARGNSTSSVTAPPDRFRGPATINIRSLNVTIEPTTRSEC